MVAQSDRKSSMQRGVMRALEAKDTAKGKRKSRKAVSRRLNSVWGGRTMGRPKKRETPEHARWLQVRHQVEEIAEDNHMVEQVAPPPRRPLAPSSSPVVACRRLVHGRMLLTPRARHAPMCRAPSAHAPHSRAALTRRTHALTTQPHAPHSPRNRTRAHTPARPCPHVHARTRAPTQPRTACATAPQVEQAKVRLKKGSPMHRKSSKLAPVVFNPDEPDDSTVVQAFGSDSDTDVVTVY